MVTERFPTVLRGVDHRTIRIWVPLLHIGCRSRRPGRNSMRVLRRGPRSVLAAASALAVACGVVMVTGGTASAVSPDIVISQVYGGGGNTGAQYHNDFIELFNRGAS